MKKNILIIILFSLSLFPCFAQQDSPAQQEQVQPRNYYEQPAERFMDLRNQVFSAVAQIAGMKVSSPTEPWGVVMEIGVPEGIGTLVSFKDGTASFYISTGKVITGAEKNKDVSVAAKYLVDVSKDFVSGMTKAEDYPLPDVGKVRFYMFISSGIFTGEQLDEKELAEGAHPLSGLYYLGYEVIEALQRIDKKPDSHP